MMTKKKCIEDVGGNDMLDASRINKKYEDGIWEHKMDKRNGDVIWRR